MGTVSSHHLSRATPQMAFFLCGRSITSGALYAAADRLRGTNEGDVASRSAVGDRQNARTVCTIGTQPVMPAVYGVKAPL